MRVRIWNAFASNNSGSYVIVGRFPTAELASQVAEELLAVSRAQSEWRASERTMPSPLATYAASQGIPDVAVHDDEWPDYSGMSHPAVWAMNHQVFLHSDYTVTISRVIGHLMYARGGRVETKLDHAHHAIASTFEVYFPWQTRNDIDVPARVQDIVDALWSSNGAAVSLARKDHSPAWRGVLPGAAQGFGEPDLVIGVAFQDLQAGFSQVALACASVGAQVHVRISESPSRGDPFAHLRPTVPRPRT
jgi:hypothetical protein